MEKSEDFEARSRVAYWEGFGLGLEKSLVGGLAIIVYVIAALLLGWLAPERLYPSFAGSIAIVTPPVIVFARHVESRVLAAVIAVAALTYGAFQPEDGDLGLWRIVPYALLLVSVCSFAIRALRFWWWPLAFAVAIKVSTSLFGRLPDSAIFPLGYLVICMTLVVVNIVYGRSRNTPSTDRSS